MEWIKAYAKSVYSILFLALAGIVLMMLWESIIH